MGSCQPAGVFDHDGLVEAFCGGQGRRRWLAGIGGVCVLCGSLQSASILALGDLPGGTTASVAYALSPDGQTVVGTSTSATGSTAFVWTRSGGMEELPGLFPELLTSSARGVSAAGNVVVGQLATSTEWRGYRWEPSTGVVPLGSSKNSFFSSAESVSADGNSIAGRLYRGGESEAFLWTISGGIVGLGDLPGGISESGAFGISADGSTVVGYGVSDSGYEAFRWTGSGGMAGLGDLAGGTHDSGAQAASADGRFVVGYGNSDAGYEAFRWSPEGGMVGLGDLPGGDAYSVANAVSASGTVVVGFGSTDAGGEAFVWTPGFGMVSLEDELRSQGADLTGWTELRSANGISPDGRYVVGFGNYNGAPQAFVVDLGGIAFTHAPEASTWAALVGLGLVTGWVGWSRARRQP